MSTQFPFPPVIRLAATTKDAAHVEAATYAQRGMIGVWIIQELHDDSCLAGNTSKDRDCRCQPDYVLMEATAHLNFMAFDAAMRARAKARCN